MEEIILEYLIEKYKPHTMILYGSYQNGSNNKNSDFDVLLITDSGETQHDGAVIQGVELDAFIYSDQDFGDNVTINKYIQVFDGRVVKDEKGMGKKLIDDVRKYIQQHTIISEGEKTHLVEWCYKMFARIHRGDTEGMFGWHWLLQDSLEIYCNMRDIFYFGPKKHYFGCNKMIKTGIC